MKSNTLIIFFFIALFSFLGILFPASHIFIIIDIVLFLVLLTRLLKPARINGWIDYGLAWSFYVLFGLTPLIWTSVNYELFEYNKMMFIYAMTVVVVLLWVLKMIRTRQFIFQTTPLDIPLLLFIFANIISTTLSTDRHLSLWGYYSRSNGGLISLLSYTVLFYALVSNFTGEYVHRFLKSALWGGVIVSLYAIPEHFGVDPSCILLNGEANATCWVQDVQSRVFATLGQPNWLAAYLAMLLFPSLYFVISSKKTSSKVLYLIVSALIYSAFTFTFSRGATLGILTGMGMFVFIPLLIGIFYPIEKTIGNLAKIAGISLLVDAAWYIRSGLPKDIQSATNFILRYLAILSVITFTYIITSHTKKLRTSLRSYFQFKWLVAALIIFLAINLLYGSALTRFTLFTQSAPPPKPTTTIAVTQLESGGTESGQIRLIVWKGAWEIFKHYPLFGSGVETFAYAYYSFRPVEHNLVSEWDFLYNKAHNEYLNYLATTGLVGLGTYLFLIGSFIWWALNQIYHKENRKDISSFLILSLLCSYLSYAIQNFFGFSVTIIALFFFIFPALAFMMRDAFYPLIFPKRLIFLQTLTRTVVYRSKIQTKLSQITVILVGLLILNTLLNFWWGDYYFAIGSHNNEIGNPGKAYNALIQASQLNSKEPLYKSELGYAAAGAAVAMAEEDATLSAQLRDQADISTNESLQISPRNVSFLRTAIRTFYLLSSIDPTYEQKTEEILERAISLAPTDPKLLYNKSLVIGQKEGSEDQKKQYLAQAISALEKAVVLKPNYRDAHYALGLFYFQNGDKQKAIQEMQIVLKLIPNDPDASQKLKQWDVN
jgi:putative inorganic carbon (hco3(-)) transporter